MSGHILKIGFGIYGFILASGTLLLKISKVKTLKLSKNKTNRSRKTRNKLMDRIKERRFSIQENQEQLEGMILFPKNGNKELNETQELETLKLETQEIETAVLEVDETVELSEN